MTEITSYIQAFRFLAGNVSFQNAAAVTPSDTVNLSNTASALWIGSTGNIKVDLEGVGDGITFNALPVGLFRARITRVYATGTTASNIISMW